MNLLDRYVLRNFMQAYIYCIVGFISIWLIFDISDSISTFLDEHVTLPRVLQYYGTQVPQILVILLPVSLLLALLFVLGRMSRANEIVSMLTAGISLSRVLMPLFLIGLLTALGSFALNYALAPHAEMARKTFFSPEHHSARVVEGQIFRNRRDARTWFVQSFRTDSNRFQNVQVLQQDAHDHIVTNYLAASAEYQAADHSWVLTQAKVVHYDQAGNITTEELLPTLVVRHWSETPFRLHSANERAELMSLPELRDYLAFNSDFPPALLAPFYTHWHYRIALPWTCMVVTLIAAPLGVGFSRRGVLASVATAILLIFALNFSTHLFLALGEGDRIPGWIAGWAPVIAFGALGLYLLRLRASNREATDFRALLPRRIVAR
ncbi:MAG: LptF/LptG family permease [Verrucomicrobia bacterium]|nr:LptF/LptG family permease [Verrucomicrobiota bacterium]